MVERFTVVSAHASCNCFVQLLRAIPPSNYLKIQMLIIYYHIPCLPNINHNDWLQFQVASKGAATEDLEQLQPASGCNRSSCYLLQGAPGAAATCFRVHLEQLQPASGCTWSSCNLRFYSLQVVSKAR